MSRAEGADLVGGGLLVRVTAEADNSLAHGPDVSEGLVVGVQGVGSGKSEIAESWHRTGIKGSSYEAEEVA